MNCNDIQKFAFTYLENLPALPARVALSLIREPLVRHVHEWLHP